MTAASDDGDPSVPIGSAIVSALKVAGPRSASELARRLQLRKADVLLACRALAAKNQIRRLGKRWILRAAGRCAGLTKAGSRCARAAAPGSAFCVLHEPEILKSLPTSKPLSAVPSIVEPTVPTQPTDLMPSSTLGRDQWPASPAVTEPVPELYVRGRRVTEADVMRALSMLGDEMVEAYRNGRLSKTDAYRIARNRLRTIAQMS
jgi:hypothetical protein